MKDMTVDNEKYLNEIQKKCPMYRHVLIYGAGRKAVALFDFIEANTDIHISAFIVTNDEENKKIERGVKVIGIENCDYNREETIILIGVRSRWNETVQRSLTEHGFLYYIPAPQNIDFLGEKDLDRVNQPVLQITTLIGCAINCRYCPQDHFIRSYENRKNNIRSMSFDDFKTYIDKTDENVILEFAGFSEPFFNKECTQMLKYANQKKHPIELFTTLCGMSNQDFEEIKDIPFREVVIHLPDEKENSHISVNKEYISLLKSVLEYSNSDGKPFVDWCSCHGPVAPSVRELVAGRVRILTQLHDRAGNLNDKSIEITTYKKGDIFCGGAPKLNHNVLLPNGEIVLCDSDWGMRHVIGDLNSDSYQDILNGESVQCILYKMKIKDSDIICRKCCYAVEA